MFADAPLPAIRLEDLQDKGDILIVWQESTNNIAVIDNGTVSLSSSLTELGIGKEKFNLIGKLGIRVEHEGKPISYGQVTVSDGKREFKELIDPSSKGTIYLFGVAPSDLKVTTNYKSNGESRSSKQSFELKLNRDTLQPTFVVSLSDDVETIGGPARSKDSAEPKKETPDQDNKETKEEAKAEPAKKKGSSLAQVIGQILVYLLAAGVGTYAIFYLMQYGKNNSGQVQSGLKRIGVTVPDPSSDPDDLAAMGMPDPNFGSPAPQPPQKIILDDAQPIPLAPTPPAPVAIPPISGQPLIAFSNGLRFEIGEGDNKVGREAGLDLSLVGESSVSRNHAVLTRQGSVVTVADLGSTNGTFVNGTRITDRTVLKPGDNIQFGQVAGHFQG